MEERREKWKKFAMKPPSRGSRKLIFFDAPEGEKGRKITSTRRADFFCTLSSEGLMLWVIDTTFLNFLAT